jgi:hypothetical protein
MSDIEHGYGRMQGHGNRYSHRINDIILDHMVNETTIPIPDDTSEWGIPKRSRRRWYKLSDIAAIVREGMKGDLVGNRKKRVVSWDTIIRHLDELVAKRVLLEVPNRGRNNEGYFLLTRRIRVKA